MCLRYGWSIPNTPTYCGCGSRNSIDHILVCKRGGYVSLRHNAVRNTEAKMMEEVCRDVMIEPGLISTAGQEIRGKTEDGARLDVSARGVWSKYERTFFDIRVTHPNAESHMKKSLEALYRENENEKREITTTE